MIDDILKEMERVDRDGRATVQGVAMTRFAHMKLCHEMEIDYQPCEVSTISGVPVYIVPTLHHDWALVVRREL